MTAFIHFQASKTSVMPDRYEIVCLVCGYTCIGLNAIGVHKAAEDHAHVYHRPEPSIVWNRSS